MCSVTGARLGLTSARSQAGASTTAITGRMLVLSALVRTTGYSPSVG